MSFQTEPENYGPGESGDQILWLRDRLRAHGFTKHAKDWTEADRLDVQAFQLAQDWSGTAPGGGADGLPGAKTLARLAAEPRPPATSIDTVPWKLTLPIGEEEHPDEVFPIGSFQESPYFVRTPTGHLLFRAYAGGVSTSGSDYARSELREMKGTARAAWPTKTGVHTLSGRLAITALPKEKPDLCFGQFHDATSDVVELRIEGSRIFAEHDGERVDDYFVTDYRLGTFFDYRIVADFYGIHVFFNGAERAAFPGSWTDCYAKAGAYVQSNLHYDLASAYGEVDYEALSMKHAA